MTKQRGNFFHLSSQLTLSSSTRFCYTRVLLSLKEENKKVMTVLKFLLENRSFLINEYHVFSPWGFGLQDILFMLNHVLKLSHQDSNVFFNLGDFYQFMLVYFSWGPEMLKMFSRL